MATFREIAALSVGHLFSLSFVYMSLLLISQFGLKSGIWLLIAQVPIHCYSISFKNALGLVLTDLRYSISSRASISILIFFSLVQIKRKINTFFDVLNKRMLRGHQATGLSTY